MKQDLFQCQACGETFEKGCTDEQAFTEMKKEFGDIPEENQAVICEKCYKEFMKWYNEEKRKGH